MNFNKLFKAIKTINEFVLLAKDNVSDDFDYHMTVLLDITAQRVLWHLTRGEQGKKDGYSLSTLNGKDSVIASNKPIASFIPECCGVEWPSSYNHCPKCGEVLV